MVEIFVFSTFDEIRMKHFQILLKFSQFLLKFRPNFPNSFFIFVEFCRNFVEILLNVWFLNFLNFCLIFFGNFSWNFPNFWWNFLNFRWYFDQIPTKFVQFLFKFRPHLYKLTFQWLVRASANKKREKMKPKKTCNVDLPESFRHCSLDLRLPGNEGKSPTTSNPPLSTHNCVNQSTNLCAKTANPTHTNTQTPKTGGKNRYLRLFWSWHWFHLQITEKFTDFKLIE